MKNKKIIGGALAGIVLLAAATTCIGSFVAKADSLANGRVAWYTFDDGKTENKVDGGSNAAAIVTGLGNYSGDMSYGTDRRAQDGSRAIRLGDYGLKINEENLGETYSVSVWLKPDGSLPNNSNVLFLGYHNPEQWMSVAGFEGKQAAKLWGKGAAKGYTELSWTQYGSSFALTASDWHHLVVNDDGMTTTVYVDGKKVTSGATNGPLIGANQDIYVGVNNWDAEFAGYVDDIMVYNRVLTEGEIQRIFTDTTPEDLLKEEGIQLDELKMAEGQSKKVSMKVASSAQEEDGFKLSFEMADESIATVDKDGVITAIKPGETTISVKATLGKTTVSDTASIKVVKMADAMIAQYTFDDNSLASEIISGDEAKAVVTGLSAYDGELSYADGRNGKALVLGEYGLDLNKKNLGNDFTVSAWLRPDGVLPSNSAIMLLGHDNPELWYALAGAGNNSAKVWARDTVNGTGYAWTVFNTVEISEQTWHNIVFTGNSSEMCAYLDGMLIASADTEYPMTGANQNIYVGVNAWDPEFTGLVDDITVYDLCLSEEQIQEANQEAFNAYFEERLKEVTAAENILGENTNVDEIAFDLELPASVLGHRITWTSSDEKLLSSDGMILESPKDDTQLTLTAEVTYGKIAATNVIPLTLKALDREALDALIAEAKAADTTGKSEISITRLHNAIKEAEQANTCKAVEEARIKLNKALHSLGTSEVYDNPFSYIMEPEYEVTVKKGEKATVFELPVEVEGSVSIEYVSENEKIVSYVDGEIKGLSKGDAIVTAIVTAKSDGWQMEYSSAVTVTDDKNTPSDNNDKEDKKDNKNKKDKKKSKATNKVNANGTKVIEDDATALSNAIVPIIDDAQKELVKAQLETLGIQVTSVGSIYTQLPDGAIIFIDGSAYTSDGILILVPSTIITSDGRMIGADNKWIATVRNGVVVLTMDGRLHTTANSMIAPAFNQAQLDAISYNKVPYVAVNEVKEAQIQSVQKISDTAIIQENGAGLTLEVQTMTKGPSVNWMVWITLVGICVLTSVVFVLAKKKFLDK